MGKCPKCGNKMPCTTPGCPMNKNAKPKPGAKKPFPPFPKK